ncbi:XRE family transcriptional regulator [Pseudomonas sp. SG20052]|uniref:XRE family transcriptional regulator n=1 Tax=Pseudomonas sp. SG20052 TaxID=3074147 RepID=UPI00287F4C4E|nr:XRE family transcriptional regulator [Pseudomonas sp. SG20052]WNF58448.1 XRE family transcriptional regulator [Pseudomonas sp. SG20052]WNF58462.1 XRE family transcriptional regulator [Pseudomonas sp. SG20052]
MESEPGSTNVYADLGFENPVSMLRKAQIVSQLHALIGKSENDLAQAAKVIQLNNDQLKHLLLGRFEDIEEDVLIQYLDKIIASRPRPA